jgi:hypothetical protein
MEKERETKNGCVGGERNYSLIAKVVSQAYTPVKTYLIV